MLCTMSNPKFCLKAEEWNMFVSRMGTLVFFSHRFLLYLKKNKNWSTKPILVIGNKWTLNYVSKIRNKPLTISLQNSQLSSPNHWRKAQNAHRVTPPLLHVKSTSPTNPPCGCETVNRSRPLTDTRSSSTAMYTSCWFAELHLKTRLSTRVWWEVRTRLACSM